MRFDFSKYYSQKFSIPFNKQVFDKYINYLSDNHDDLDINQRTLADYIARTVQFIDSLDTPLNIENYGKIQLFLNSDVVSNSTKSRRLSALKRLSGFLKTEYGINYLDSISYQKDKSEVKKKAQALSLNQIILLRNELHREKQYKQLLAFEMVYSYGCTLDELVEHCYDNYDSGGRYFSLSKRRIYLSSELAAIIEANDNILRKLSLSSYQLFFSKFKNVLNRDVSWDDINQSFKAYSSICPVCGNRYINESVYWILARDKNDCTMTKWFVCTSVCAHRFGINNG